MKKFITIAAGTLAALGFSAPAFAQAGSVQGGMSAEEHQQMMSAKQNPSSLHDRVWLLERIHNGSTFLPA